MKFCFGDIVVVENILLGVIVRSWIGSDSVINYDVYVRNYNRILNYPEKYVERYMVRHKELNKEEIEYQYNAIHGY